MKKLQEGAIGKVFSVHANFGVKISEIDRIKRKDLGGGAIVDLCIYAINVVQMVFNDDVPLEIKAVGFINENGNDNLAYNKQMVQFLNSNLF